jgi:UDP-N-acetylmuramate: L-alanyl-gamma-D-glutamyl-meso-diaminopimelate ligase
VVLVYNEEDLEVKRVAEAATKPTRKLAYTTQIIKWKTEQLY